MSDIKVNLDNSDVVDTLAYELVRIRTIKTIEDYVRYIRKEFKVIYKATYNDPSDEEDSNFFSKFEDAAEYAAEYDSMIVLAMSPNRMSTKDILNIDYNLL